MPVSAIINEGIITRKVNNNIPNPIVTTPAISGQTISPPPLLLLFLSFLSFESLLTSLNVLHQRHLKCHFDI
jgi:hypothetical protein